LKQSLTKEEGKTKEESFNHMKPNPKLHCPKGFHQRNWQEKKKKNLKITKIPHAKPKLCY